MQLLKDIGLAKFTTFKIGGRARYFTHVSSIEDLKNAFNLSWRKQLPVFVLGKGSNVLISDSGFEGVVIKNEISGVEFEESAGRKVWIKAGAGENWDDIVEKVVSRGLSGLELLSGIPGTVGASVVQNIGAYGSEAGLRLVWAEIFDPYTFLTYRISKKDCQLGYRSSIFKTKKGRHLVVTSACFELEKREVLDREIGHNGLLKQLENATQGDEITPYVMRQAVLDLRMNRLPLLQNVGTAGSFFKNPSVDARRLNFLLNEYGELPYYCLGDGLYKIPAGWLIEKVGGFKGCRFQDAGVWNKHALIFVNYGNANAGDIKCLADTISRRIEERTGIHLEWEVEYVGH